MNGDLRPVALSELPPLDEATFEFARVSHPLLGGWWGEELVCLVGFVPATVISDRAYLWFHGTPAAEAHRTAIGRWARRLIPEALHRYPVLFGYCDDRSQHWLHSLGAKITPAFGNIFHFEIRA